ADRPREQGGGPRVLRAPLRGRVPGRRSTFSTRHPYADPMKPVASRVRGIQPSPTVRLGTVTKELQAKGEWVENLSIGEPDFPTPAHIVEAAKRALDDVPMTKYVSLLGLRDLREEIPGKSQKENGIPADPDHVLVAPTKHCLFLALTALVEAG